MRRLIPFIALLLLSLLVAGCGGKRTASPSPALSTETPGAQATTAHNPGPPPRQTPAVSSIVPAPTPGGEAVRRVFDSPQGTMFEALFPRGARKAPCLIPRGGPGQRPIAGICETKLVYNWGGGGPLVVFTESWPYRQFHAGGSKRAKLLSHSWSFVVSGAKVRLVKQSGDFPPQMAR